MNGDVDPAEIAVWTVIAFVITALTLIIITITGG